MSEKPPLNRRQRRAQQSKGKLTAIQGGKPTPPDTPAQRLGFAMQSFMKQYMQGHGGIDAMNAAKVVMQYAASVALDVGARREDFLLACGDVFDQEQEARAPAVLKRFDKEPDGG